MASTSKAVNRPVDNTQKERDINNKLQLYGMYNAFANGKVPSNKQIDIALNSAIESPTLTKPSERLSPEGRKLVGDLRNVIEQAKILLLSKNEGNLLQDFIWQTQQITSGNSKAPEAPVDRQTAQEHGQQALEGFRTLGTLIITNGQFRKLLNDATILLRSIAGDAATKAASKVNPTEDQLNQIDDPSADNVWHDAPDLSKENIKGQFSQRMPFGKGEVKQAAGDAAEAAHPEGSRDPADVASAAATEQQTGQPQGIDTAAGVQTGAGRLKDTAAQNVPEEKKDKTREYRERTTAYLKGKMPKERREQTIWRLKKMVVEIQNHQDYEQAVETLLTLAETYGTHGKTLAGQSAGAVKDVRADDALKNAELDLKTLIERFANSTSLDDLFDSINQIYRDADQDPELKEWFKKVDTYIRKCLKETGYIMQDASTDDWNTLYDQGNYLLRDKYRRHTDRVLDEFKFLGNQFDTDPQNKAFGDAMQKLFVDLGNDENGKPTFKPHLVKDLTEVIIPEFLVNVRYIPIPRIEYSDPQVDVVVENLVVESDNLTPNVLEFSTDNYWRWGRKQIENRHKNKIMLAVSGVQLDLRDVCFWLNRKQGFPSIKDTGVCDIFMGGSGLSFKIAAETADKSDNQHFFKITKVDVDIKNVKITMKRSTHKLLFTIGKSILIRALRPAIQRAIEKQIKDNAYQLDGIIWQVHQEAQKAKEDAINNPDPENIQNIYQRYITAAQQRFAQAKQKTKDIVEDRKANVAMTQEDSIFPDVKLPNGISSKATEYKQLASKGDKWESPIFSIGRAKETAEIPKPATIKRKHALGTGAGTSATAGLTNGTSGADADAKVNGAPAEGVNAPAAGKTV